MKDVIRIELKKALNLRIFAALMAAVLIYSVYTGVSYLSTYDLYDGSGNISITAKENLKESKKHDMLLDEQTLQDVVDRKDKSLFAYNSSLVILVAKNYDKKVTELTKADIRDFYQNRTEGVLKQAEEYADLMHTTLSKAKEKDIKSRGDHINKPIRLGYKEGWHGLNAQMGQLAVAVLILASIAVIPIFTQNPKTKMKEVCLAAQKGKMAHYNARAIAGLLVGVMIYIPSMLIFAITRLAIFGPQGGTLPIQGSVAYFFSAWNVSYIQQFLINFGMGLLAVLLMLSVVLFCGALLEQIISTGVLVAFLWVFMLMPQPANIVHYFSGFMPYNMLAFSGIYTSNETYRIFGTVLPSYVWISMAAVCLFLFFMFALYCVARYKVSVKPRVSLKLQDCGIK